MTSNPDVILFDIDDTLYPTLDAEKTALNAVINYIKDISNTSSLIVKDYYTYSRNYVKLCLGNSASSHSRLLYFQRTLELLKISNLPFHSLRCEEIFWSHYLECITPQQDLVSLFET